MKIDDNIDQLFKDGLSDPEIPFNEEDWKKMELKLDDENKRRIIPLWLFTAAGIAAVFAIVLFWFFTAPLLPAEKKEILADKGGKAAAPALKTGEKRMDTIGEQADAKPDAGSRILFPDPITGEPFFLAEPLLSRKELSAPLSLSDDLLRTVLAKEKPATEMHLIYPVPLTEMPVKETESTLLERKANALANSRDPLEKITASEIVRSVQKKMDDELSQQNNLILSAMAAPDISTAKSSKSSKLSSNLGMLATFAFNRNISITSGAVYAKKYYNSAGTAPGDNGYMGQAWEVDAVCNVLDIPVNVNYKVLQKKRLSVSLNTGLSSYFMLKEKYDFITGTAGGGQQVSTLELANENRHLFGVANVSVSFDHKISQNLSVGVQPFAKLPLTGIGNGNVNLKSTGVSFSLNIGLFPVKKAGSYAAVNYSGW